MLFGTIGRWRCFPLMIFRVAFIPVLLIGWSVGQPLVSPNYRWCAHTSRGLVCVAEKAQCQALSRRSACELRLVAEPSPSGQPTIPR